MTHDRRFHVCVLVAADAAGRDSQSFCVPLWFQNLL